MKFLQFRKPGVGILAMLLLIAVSGAAFGESKQKGADLQKAEQTKAARELLGVAAEEGNFGTFLDAVKTAGLEKQLSGPGPFTVFAPTDEAFNQLPPEQKDKLLKPENKNALRKLLLNHIAKGSLKAEQLAKKKSLKTLGGQTLKIGSKDGTVMIGSAQVVKPDRTATNGVLQGIDAVLGSKKGS